MPGTLEMNGVAERRNNNLMDIVRSKTSTCVVRLSFGVKRLKQLPILLKEFRVDPFQETPFELWIDRISSVNHFSI